MRVVVSDLERYPYAVSCLDAHRILCAVHFSSTHVELARVADAVHLPFTHIEHARVADGVGLYFTL